MDPATEGNPDRERHSVRHIAEIDARIWRGHGYFAEAEEHLPVQWDTYIWPMIHDCDFGHVVDLATGHGRNAERLLELAERLTLVDILDENIAACRRRFGDDPRVRYLVNDGTDLTGVADDSVSLVYCFDAMVHFDSDVVRSYLHEFARTLRRGGRAFCHHSNYSGAPTGDFRSSPHARNFMTRELFAHYAGKAGLRVLRARPIRWDIPDLDCLTLLTKPAN